MSGELTKARQRLTSIGSSLKQGKYMAAAQALNDAIVIMLSAQLMKSERDEFAQMLDDAVYALNNNKELRKVFPLVLNYAPGEEKKLLDQIFEMRKLLQEDVNEEAQKDLAALELNRQAELDRGQKHLEQQEFELAKQVFDRLVAEYAGDADLKAEVAERYQKTGLNEEAVAYLSAAITESPDSLHLYNRIGIVLRKMQDFQSAENYYNKALELTQADEYLFFNLGRLYFDWQRWDKTAEAAQRALGLNPDFQEARKLLAYAQKKMAGA
ncbi:MAG: tetratricopeptide repeat protein [Proteobacteria bacterium]|nr:tetratricopeptide repeat protein [Pseudomonadota bacterium]MBU1595506.1 tetratricopeptide repeat protein [Pseudomonadota bacterium]